MNPFAKLVSLLPSGPVKRTIRYDDAGFAVIAQEGVTVQITWDSVVEIVVFKRDHFSFDEICFGFRCRGRDDYEWVGEEDLEFSAFQAEVEKRYSGIRTDWFKEVAVPALHENWTVIWGSPLSRDES